MIPLSLDEFEDAVFYLVHAAEHITIETRDYLSCGFPAEYPSDAKKYLIDPLELIKGCVSSAITLAKKFDFQ